MLRTIVPFGLTALIAMAAGVQAAEDATPAGSGGAAVQAAWQSYDIDFPYMGSTTRYSCTGIENRLEQLLQQLGARSDVRVAALGCIGNEVEKTISTRLRVNMPSAAGDGEKLTAKPATVTLRSSSSGSAGPGDCELLEQLRDRVLPKLGLKVEKDDLRCPPGQAVSSAGTLQVAALLPEKGAGQSK